MSDSFSTPKGSTATETPVNPALRNFVFLPYTEAPLTREQLEAALGGNIDEKGWWLYRRVLQPELFNILTDLIQDQHSTAQETAEDAG